MIRNELSEGNIGELEQCLEVLRFLRREASPLQTLRDYMMDDGPEAAESLKGMLQLLRYLGYVVGDEAELRINTNDEVTAEQFLQNMFNKLEEDGVLSTMLAPPITSLEGEIVVLNNGLLPRKYSPLRNFLLNSKIMRDTDGSMDILNVDEKYTYLFKKYAEVGSKPKSSEELGKELEDRARRGREAEEFVVAYERRQRSGHPQCDQIHRISEENVEAGYDVASYASDESAELDKFIEVKSYLGAKRIYWSRNEQKKAEKLGTAYFLYLVDSDRIQEPGYEPEIIANPHQTLQNAERTCETWRYDLT